MKNVCLAAMIALLSGCSLINSLDSVKAQSNGTDDDDGGSGRGGKGGKGSGGRESSGGAAGNAGEDMGGGSGTGGSSGGTGGMDAGSGGDVTDSGSGGMAEPDSGSGDGGPAFKAGGPNGAIVAYDPVHQKVFVLDPTDGHSLSSVASPVIEAMVNDPATDYWYFWQQMAQAGGPTELVVKQLNTTTGEWHDVGKSIQVPTPINPDIGVLNQRLAYLSLSTTADPNASTLTVLDTTSVSSLFVRANAKALPPGAHVAITARASATDVGGSVSIAISTLQTGAACMNGVCNLDVSVIGETITGNTIKEDSAPTPIGTVNATGGNIGFASTETTDPAGARDVAVIPPLTLPGPAPVTCDPTTMSTGSAYLLDPSHARSGSAVAFNIANVRINFAAFDACHSIAFATSLLGDTAIWAIPLAPGASGTPTSQKLCAPGGGPLYYDRYSQGLVRLVQKGGGVGSIELYDVDSSDDSAPKLNARTLHLPSPFGVSSFVAVRRSNVCK